GEIASAEDWARTLYPSGSAFTTAAVPSEPPAPGRFSTTMAWPSSAERRSNTTRGTTAAALPAPNEMVALISRDGQFSAQAAAAAKNNPKIIVHRIDAGTNRSSARRHVAPQSCWQEPPFLTNVAPLNDKITKQTHSTSGTRLRLIGDGRNPCCRRLRRSRRQRAACSAGIGHLIWSGVQSPRCAVSGRRRHAMRLGEQFGE